MFRSTISRGVSAGALTLALSSFACAQQSLPTIDVGAARGKPQHPQNTSAGVGTGAGARPSEASIPRSLQLGGRLTRYNAVGPVSSSKTNIPILQTPYAVQVVTRETMDDRQVVSVRDALLENVSSVSIGNQFYDRFNIRGFDSPFFYRNGLRQVETTDFETTNLQSIEVLKGPAAMLYGRVEPGGIVNLIPKRPQSIPYYSIQEQAGNFGFTRTSLDATGPLTQDKSLAYRVNLSYLNKGSFRDFVNAENFLIAPTISWRPTDRFTLNIDGEFQKSNKVDDAGIVAVSRRPANIPISRYLGDPAITTRNRNAQERALFAYDWTYEFVDDWRVVNRFSYTNVDYKISNPAGGYLNEATGELWRYLYHVPYANRNAIATNVDIQGKVITGPLTHKLLTGFDYYNFDEKFKILCCDDAFVKPINIYSPIYSGTGLGPYVVNGYWIVKDKWIGLYAQDQISLWEDRIHILLGGRHDWAETSNAYTSMSFSEADLSRIVIPTSANSPRVGLLIQPFPWLSVYGNYTRSYGSSNGVSAQNEPLPPQVGIQYEGGVKAELLERRLTATFAYFDIFKANIVRPVPGSPFGRPVGEAESRGVEFDLTGRIDDNWSVIANYSHIDVQFTKDDPRNLSGTISYGNDVYSRYLVGKRLASVPRNQANLWLKYEALGEFKGLSFGGGAFYVDQRPGDDVNTFELPAYVRVDAMAAYRFKAWALPFAPDLTLQVNVKNLLGTTYYDGSTTRFNVAPGAPRSFLASLRMEF